MKQIIKTKVLEVLFLIQAHHSPFSPNIVAYNAVYVKYNKIIHIYRKSLHLQTKHYVLKYYWVIWTIYRLNRCVNANIRVFVCVVFSTQLYFGGIDNYKRRINCQ